MLPLSVLHAAPGCDYTGEPLPEKYVAELKAVKKRRAGRVIAVMLEKGRVTQAELEAMGYTHGPRAVRDVRELGFDVVTARGADGFAVYAFDKPSTGNALAKSRGRTVLEKKLRKALADEYGAKDFITLEPVALSELQVDHRIPYEIGGEPDHSDLTKFMLLTLASNRAKSHACENCPNWAAKDAAMCEECFWAHPEGYGHIAGRAERRLPLVFFGEDAETVARAQNRHGDAIVEEAKKAVVATFKAEEDAEKPPRGAGA